MFLTLSTANHVPKNIKNQNVDGNVTMVQLNYRRAVCILEIQYLRLCTFSTSYVYFATQTEAMRTGTLSGCKHQYKYTF